MAQSTIHYIRIVRARVHSHGVDMPANFVFSSFIFIYSRCPLLLLPVPLLPLLLLLATAIHYMDSFAAQISLSFVAFAYYFSVVVVAANTKNYYMHARRDR